VLKVCGLLVTSVLLECITVQGWVDWILCGTQSNC